MRNLIFLLVLFVMLTACHQATTNSTSVKDSTAGSPSNTFVPANENEKAIYSRAFNAVVWGMPAVNSELMHEDLLKAKDDYNQVVYWSGLLNSKNQTLTPNPDVIYINPFYDTRKGPVVLEIPAAEGVSSITEAPDFRFLEI